MKSCERRRKLVVIVTVCAVLAGGWGLWALRQVYLGEVADRRVLDELFSPELAFDLSRICLKNKPRESATWLFGDRHSEYISEFRAYNRLPPAVLEPLLRTRMIERLLLTSEHISDQSFQLLARMPLLKSLTCHSCQFEPVSRQLVWRELIELNLAGSNLDTPTFASLTANGRLRVLRISQCPLTDSDIANAVSRNPQLEVVDVTRTQCSDVTAKRIASLGSLSDVSLMATAISDVGISEFCHVSTLKTLGCDPCGAPRGGAKFHC